MDKKNNSTLQDMILLEKSTEKNLVAVDALMWLRRYLSISFISFLCLYTYACIYMLTYKLF